jgi:hypothetical protein
VHLAGLAADGGDGAVEVGAEQQRAAADGAVGDQLGEPFGLHRLGAQ